MFPRPDSARRWQSSNVTSQALALDSAALVSDHERLTYKTTSSPTAGPGAAGAAGGFTRFRMPPRSSLVVGPGHEFGAAAPALKSLAHGVGKTLPVPQQQHAQTAHYTPRGLVSASSAAAAQVAPVGGATQTFEANALFRRKRV